MAMPTAAKGSPSHRSAQHQTPTTEQPNIPRPQPARARRNPDDEALEIMLRFADRLAVARSLTKMVTSLFRASAAQAGVQARRAARAAKDAALHVTAQHVDVRADRADRTEPPGDAST